MSKVIQADCTICKVSECPVAKHCTAGGKKKINAEKIVISYRKLQPIVKEDTVAAGIYIIHAGRVLIVSERKDFERQIIRLALPGDILEHKTDDHKIKSPFTAEAFDDSVICFIPKTLFFQLLEEDRNFTLHLEQLYANQFIKAEQRLKHVLVMNARAKIADALLIVAKSFDGDVPFSRKELGELIGISADQVSRELKRLSDDGSIEIKGKNNRVIIKNSTKLLGIVKEYDEHYSI